MRVRDMGIEIGRLPTGPENAMTDVPGVSVGHAAAIGEDVRTGVTAVLPHAGNLFREKVLAVTHVINGYGKSLGLMQIDELGTIESPILLCSTRYVGAVADASIRLSMAENPEIGRKTGTVNPVVCECNDSYLHDFKADVPIDPLVVKAVEAAEEHTEEGCVGAGTGMSSYGLKGGIGTSSRRVEVGDEIFHIGILVLSNFGEGPDLIVGGRPVGRALFSEGEVDKGSIIILLGTDLPVSERQLGRMARRAVVGLGRTGSYLGNGSGDVVIGFSTANRSQHWPESTTYTWRVLAEDRMDLAFRGVIEATEEAVLNALVVAESLEGRAGHKRLSLRDRLQEKGYTEAFGENPRGNF